MGREREILQLLADGMSNADVAPEAFHHARRPSRATCATSSRSSRPIPARRPSRSPCASRSSPSDQLHGRIVRTERPRDRPGRPARDRPRRARGPRPACRGSRQRAERELRGRARDREQLSEQADALDRLLAATTGLTTTSTSAACSTASPSATRRAPVRRLRAGPRAHRGRPAPSARAHRCVRPGARPRWCLHRHRSRRDARRDAGRGAAEVSPLLVGAPGRVALSRC